MSLFSQYFGSTCEPFSREQILYALHIFHNVQVSVLERVRGQSKALRFIRESEWINRLSTKIPSELNSKVRQM